MMPDILGTLPQWLMVLFSGGAFGLLVKWQLGKGKLAIDAKQVEVNAQQISGQERADIRDHYAQEVNRYYQQVVGLRDELEECETKCAAEIKKLQDDLAGERTQRVTEQITLVRVLLDAVGDSPHLQKFMKALESIQSAMPHLSPPEERGIEPMK